MDFAAPERPKTGYRTKEGALSRAGWSAQQHVVAASERKVHVRDERLAAGEVEFNVFHDQTFTVDGGVMDASRDCRLDAYNLESPLETRESFHDGAPCSNVCVRGNDEAKRILHLAKRRSSLHESAKQNLTPEVALGHDDEGENDRCLRVSRSEPCKPLLLSHNAPPVAHYAAETFAKTTELAGFTVVKCHALRVLTETDEAETEVGFVALLIEVQPDERTANSIR
jgi:hypothetical protein